MTPEHQSKIGRYLMRFRAYRFLREAVRGRDTKGFPEWIAKTDEENIQKCGRLVAEHFDEPWVATEKLEGQSGTFFARKTGRWPFTRIEFGVCSRSVRRGRKPDNSNYWNVALKYDLQNVLRKAFETAHVDRKPFETIVIQGEIIGPRIQKNIYKLDGLQLRVFSVIVDGRRLGPIATTAFCVEHHLPMVPTIDSIIPRDVLRADPNDYPSVAAELLEMSNGQSILRSETAREGLVFRLVSNPHVSFKARSPKYLLSEA